MQPLKERISITIDSDLLEKLREKADEDCRPLSQYINLVLRKQVVSRDMRKIDYGSGRNLLQGAA